MNRRNFFRNLGIATAALYLRIAPSLTETLKVEKEEGYTIILDVQAYEGTVELLPLVA